VDVGGIDGANVAVTVREKAFLAALAVIGIWAAIYFYFMPIGTPAIWAIGYMLASLFAITLSLLLVLRAFRCPHCRARFGWHSLPHHSGGQFWPMRYCSNCGADLDEKSN
jgi:DNA-directed RNA polymerase subunit RPC12/RpoP